VAAAGDMAGYVVVHVLTGTMRSRVVVTNPDGVSPVSDYANANYRQSVVEQGADRVVLEIISTRSVATSAPYPVDASRLSAEAVEALAPRAGWIQSDDPAIAAQARALTQGATREADVVEAVLAWVRGHVVYDAAGPRDALTVLQTGRAYCVGFSNLAMALLRAAGIPARGVYGCAAPWDGWGSPPSGGRHMWVEVFYPDAGWVASDAQASVNMIDTAHLVGVLDQCGKAGTSISRSEYSGTLSADDPGLLRSVTTGFASASGLPLYAASVFAPEPAELIISPADITMDLASGAPRETLTISMSTSAPGAPGWAVQSDAPWLIPLSLSGTLPGTAAFEVDVSGLPAGTHMGTLLITASPATAGVLPRTVTVTVHVAPGPPAAPSDGPTWCVGIPVVLSGASP